MLIFAIYIEQPGYSNIANRLSWPTFDLLQGVIKSKYGYYDGKTECSTIKWSKMK